ncbi:MAG: aspartate aminotransferase family protein [Promethearchaeati archaeon SRVP18_Atabeyarchaeia-1]
MLEGDAVKEYLKRTPMSKKLFEEALKYSPGGVSHNIRYFRPYPFFVKRAEGSRLIDVDNNAYTDYWMVHMSAILGHAHPEIIRAISRQIPMGFHYGTANEVSVDLAETICRNLPSAEMLRFCNSGLEATSYAVRLARGYTSKKYIVKMIGGWHGGNELQVAVTPPFDKPESKGILDEQSKFIVSVPFNDIEGTSSSINKLSGEIAGIIVEPVLGSGGCIPADLEYLKSLRELAHDNDALLIFDEVITGFRVALNSAQGYFHVKPDLTTLGKVIGGGFPIGALAGRKEIMNLADHTHATGKGEYVWIGGGTFSMNPMSMTAGLATLRFLIENPKLYDHIGRLGERARTEVDRQFADRGIPTKSTGMGSLLQTHFLREEGLCMKNAEDKSINTLKEKQSKYHFRLLVNGIFFLPEHEGAISAAHNERDIERLAEASGKIADEMLVEEKSLQSRD